MLGVDATPEDAVGSVYDPGGRGVYESIHFLAWQDAEKTPEVCSLCKDEQPVFEYRVTPEQRAADQAQEQHGYCCLRCGQQLLATLEQLTLARWAEQSPPQ